MGKIKRVVSQHKGLLVITSVYLITFLLMLPLRNVAFEDDFAYIQAVKSFVNTGILRTPEWAAPAMLVQIAWGGMFAKVFGYSIGVLHLSNIVLFYFGLLSFFLTLKRLRLGEFKAALFTLFLLSYPWVFDFTYSFMTDVFYLSLFLIAAYFYIKAFQTNSRLAFLLGSLFAGLSYLQRQIGLIIPAAVVATLLFQSVATRKILLRNIFYSILPMGTIFFIYSHWLGSVGLTYAQQHFMVEPMQEQFLPKIIPQNLRTAIGATQQYYTLALIKRLLAYFDNAIAFLLPIFLIYKFQLKSTLEFLSKNRRPIIITTFVVSVAYLIDFVTGQAYTSHMTSLILRYDIFVSPNWGTVWPKLVWISRIVWVFMIAIAAKNSLRSLFTKRRSSSFKLYKRMTKIYITVCLLLFGIFLNTNFPFIFSSRRIKLALNSLSISPGIFGEIGDLLSIKYIILGVRTGWFFFSVVLSALVISTYILITQKFKTLTKISYPLLFLGLILIGDLLIICFFNNYYYEEYVIQFIPIFIIWIAYLLRNIPISTLRAVTIILVVTLFSIASTRNRYQSEGLYWQLGEKMVEKGVDPEFISVNWPWRPYWYFENVIPTLWEEYGDDKYKMPAEKFAGWSRTADRPGIHYNSSVVPSSKSKRPDAILESEKFWLFSKQFPFIRWVEVNMGQSVVK